MLCIHIHSFSPGNPCPAFIKWPNTLNHDTNNTVHKPPHVGTMTDLFLCVFQTCPEVYVHCSAEVISHYSSSLLFTGEEASRDSLWHWHFCVGTRNSFRAQEVAQEGSEEAPFQNQDHPAMVSLICEQWDNYTPSDVNNSDSIRHRYWERSFWLWPMGSSSWSPRCYRRIHWACLA